MIEKGVLFVFVFCFPVCKYAEAFFQNAIFFMYHCYMYKSYRIILDHKVLELFSQLL